jgi:hypothetical protein
MVRDRPHILVRKSPKPELYRPHPRKIEPESLPKPSNARAYANKLKRALSEAVKQAQARRDAAGITITGAAPGLYVVFQGHKDFRLKLKSLDAQGSGIELVTVDDGDKTDKAIVFVPDGKAKYFLNKFEQYAAERTKTGERKNRPLVESIADIRLATLRALWTDPASEFPADGKSCWWEVWLREGDGQEEDRLRDYCGQIGIEVGKERLTFPDRIVVLVKARPDQLTASLDVLNDLAEVRAAKQVVPELHRMTPSEQADVAKELLKGLRAAPPNAPAVCILDTGVNRNHPLLAASLSTEDLHAYDPTWWTDDHDGHGTEMAGLALFGDLSPLARSTIPPVLAHRLESVKILPPGDGENPPHLDGAITAEAASRVEVQAPHRRRGFSLAVSRNADRLRGKPTSWSAAIDALAAGRSFDPSSKGLEYLDSNDEGPRRLFVVAAGNVETTDINHLARSDTQSIHDPGQAWNAVTVGASTELVDIDPKDRTLKGHQPVAKAGDLSPYSSTSVTFDNRWPLKPDVVFEGGNKSHDGSVALQTDCLSLMTTHSRPQKKLFVPTWATSAACSQVARHAAIIAVQYPNLWPETIRALLIHSAEWTPAMLDHVPEGGSRGEKERLLLRRFGFGIPSLDRALRSAGNALTLIVQDRLCPFADGKLHEMKIHELPWPKDELADLFDTTVKMRVTLSYFVEPNPARRGWRDRYRYASHGLRFDVRQAGQSTENFRKQLNNLALSEDEKKPDWEGDGDEWALGPNMRNHGSLHADIWTGSAADLADRGVLGVYPISGWWKDQPARDRSKLGVRYALVVSIETPENDIWTPVANQVGVHIEVPSGDEDE